MTGDDLRAAVAGACEVLGGAGEPAGPANGEPPRFELFHAANSICSQKVRTVLAHHDLPYRSHPVDLFRGETYLPGYVRLRMIGCAALGGDLAARHGGTTSTEAGGCDGVVVPTLVDWASEEVIVDSKRICLVLDTVAPEADWLRPAALADAVDRELGVVDNLPNYQMLMGRTPSGAEGVTRGDVQAAFSQRKVGWCDRYLDEQAGDDLLVRAYTAKRAKELSAATELFSPEAMRDAYRVAEAALGELEARLAARTGAWLLGERVTMADLFWGIELMRMRDVGVADYWEAGRLPEVERYAAATEALPAIRRAVTDWPGARF